MSDPNSCDKAAAKIEDEAKEGSSSEQSTARTGSFLDSWIDSLKEALPTAAEDTTPVLTDFTLNAIADYMITKCTSNVIVMCGAGISTSAGIPDFRSPVTGLYDCLGDFGNLLPDPQAIFEMRFFRRNPEPFFSVAKKLFPKNVKPTLCHYFLRLLDQKGYLRRVYTQNVDGLEYATGLDENKIVEAHGSYNKSTCMRCQKVFSIDWLTDKLFVQCVPVPKCDQCQGVVKPNIVFFGENLPAKFFISAIKDFPKCDLLIIIGTSLIVQPFAGMGAEVGARTPRLLINNCKTGQAVLDYEDKNNTRDVFYENDCDNGCQKLADLLGFGEELKHLVRTEWAKLDAKSGQKPDECPKL